MKKLIEKYGKKQFFRGVFAIVVYLAWVIWLGNYWFLLGIPIIVDMYLTKKVNWSPWKKRDQKNHWLIEWLDALIFAVIAVTIINIFLFQNYKIPTGSMEKSLLVGDHLYVSKVAFGPRIPITPLALPFMQHTIPGTNKKSYVEWVKWDYKRLKGFKKIERDEPVVFNFPAGDTVCFEKQNVSYYSIIRDEVTRLKYSDIRSKLPLKTEEEYYNKARQTVKNQYKIVVRPIDKRDNYIKRCVGLPGDSLEIIDGDVYTNGNKQPHIENMQYTYYVKTDGKRINNKILDKLGIYQSDVAYDPSSPYMIINMTENMVEELKPLISNAPIIKNIAQKGVLYAPMFPHDERYPWNLDQFGPIYIPKEGATVDINMENLPLYERIIDVYDDNDLVVKDSTIYINGEVATTYTFKQNYYWMMGDNRHSSLDSRYWGYVPEDHIIGRPRFVWLSLNKEKRFPANIRVKRMFTGIK